MALPDRRFQSRNLGFRQRPRQVVLAAKLPPKLRQQRLEEALRELRKSGQAFEALAQHVLGNRNHPLVRRARRATRAVTAPFFRPAAAR